MAAADATALILHPAVRYIQVVMEEVKQDRMHRALELIVPAEPAGSRWGVLDYLDATTICSLSAVCKVRTDVLQSSGLPLVSSPDSQLHLISSVYACSFSSDTMFFQEWNKKAAKTDLWMSMLKRDFHLELASIAHPDANPRVVYQSLQDCFRSIVAQAHFSSQVRSFSAAVSLPVHLSAGILASNS